MSTVSEKLQAGASKKEESQSRAPVATLDQWVTFLAVIDTGGFAQAGEYLHCSQSGVSYTINKLQERLGVQLFTMEGRKAILTEAGRALVDRIRVLVKDALDVEGMARQVAHGQETEIRLTVDKAFPTSLLVEALGRFSRQCPDTHVQLLESANAEEEIGDSADVAIGPQVPRDCLADFLVEVRLVAVVKRDHGLAQLGRNVTQDDLRQETQVIITDSSAGRRAHSGWVTSSGKWYVATMETALAVIRAGNGFGWLPEHMVQDALSGGDLAVLPLERGRIRAVPMYLIYPKNTDDQSATAKLVTILRKLCNS